MPRRRSLPSATLILTLLLALVACGGGEPRVDPIIPRPSIRPQSSVTPTPVPRRGGTASIGIIGDLRQLNPAFGGATLQGAIFRPVVEGLFDFDGQGQPRPLLAESVPTRGRGISDDGTTIIIRLRQGVAWEDGKPFTADDVVFTLAAGKNPNNPFADEVAAAYRTIRAADALDPYTVRLTLTAPGSDFLRAFAPVFPAHLFNGVTDLVNQPYARAPFGTGPFRVADLVPGVLLDPDAQRQLPPQGSPLPRPDHFPRLPRRRHRRRRPPRRPDRPPPQPRRSAPHPAPKSRDPRPRPRQQRPPDLERGRLVAVNVPFLLRSVSNFHIPHNPLTTVLFANIANSHYP